jgi:hypothetical protein
MMRAASTAIESDCRIPIACFLSVNPSEYGYPTNYKQFGQFWRPDRRRRHRRDSLRTTVLVDTGILYANRRTDPEVVKARVVDDWTVFTASGVTADIDLALWLVEREWGREVAFEVENAMEYERSTNVYRSGR